MKHSIFILMLFLASVSCTKQEDIIIEPNLIIVSEPIIYEDLTYHQFIDTRWADPNDGFEYEFILTSSGGNFIHKVVWFHPQPNGCDARGTYSVSGTTILFTVEHECNFPSGTYRIDDVHFEQGETILKGLWQGRESTPDTEIEIIWYKI